MLYDAGYKCKRQLYVDAFAASALGLQAIRESQSKHPLACLQFRNCFAMRVKLIDLISIYRVCLIVSIAVYFLPLSSRMKTASTELYPLWEVNSQVTEARGSVVGWGTMLQAGWSPVQVPDEVDFFNLPNPCSCTMALGSTQPLTEMSNRNFHGGKKRPPRRADNLATICEPNVWKCGSLDVSQPYGSPRPV
jgi:hypothetical protein